MTRLIGRTWITKSLIALALLVMVVIVAFIFRRPLAVKGIEHFSKAHNIIIQCLDFSFAWPFSLTVQKACVSSSMGTLVIQDMTWQLWSNDLAIEELRINHVNAARTQVETTTEQQTEVLDLPESLPKLNIKNVHLRSKILLHPINLTVSSTSNTEVKITGDLTAAIQFTPNNVTTNIEWRLHDLTKFIPQIQEWLKSESELLKDVDLEQSKVSTLLIYNGKSLETESTLDIASGITINNCPIDGVFKGKVIADLTLADFSINVDLSQLSNQISAENCSLLQGYFTEGEAPQLSLFIPKPFTISSDGIKIPKLSIIDLQSKHKVDITRTIELSDLNYKTAGTLEVNYHIILKQPLVKNPINNIQLSAEMMDFQGAGQLFVDISNLKNQNAEQPIPFKITDDMQQLSINNLDLGTLTLAELNSEFKFNHSSASPLLIKGTVKTSTTKLNSINIDQTTSNFVVTGKNHKDLQLSLDNQLAKLQLPNFSLQHISNHLDLNITDLNSISATGDSSITNLTAQNINFKPINITHFAQGNWQNQSLSSQHNINLEQGFTLEVTQQQSKINMLIVEQEITALEGIVAQVNHVLVVTKGELSANVDLTLPQDSQELLATGQANIQNLSVKYQDYLVNNIRYQTPVTFNSAGLQLPSSNLHIDSVDVGVTATDLTANVFAKNSVPALQQVKGNIFNGEFLLPALWLDGRDQQVNVNLNNIDLAEVMALQQQPGINITGKVNGDLPMIVNQQGIMVNDGWLSSLAGGKLTIVNNPSFDSIKAQQPELALLENLDFTQLDSNVKFNPDGWVFFDIALKGNNPDKNQSVNFNYSHEENLYSLLESIRLVNAVGDTIEQKINQGDKK